MSDDPTRNPDGTMKKGFSANAKGRPPRSRNLVTIFNEKRDELIQLKNEPRKMSRMEAFVTNLWNRAVALDPKAVAQVLAVMRASGQLAPLPAADEAIDMNSEAALEALISRITKKSDDAED